MKKELSNYMKIEFPSQFENKTFTSNAVSEFVEQLNPTVEELKDIKAIVAEAVANAVDHAYPKNKHGKITVEVSIFNNKLVEIKVSDRGCGIDDVEKAKIPMFTTGSSIHSGLGFTVMESFADKIIIKSKFFTFFI